MVVTSSKEPAWAYPGRSRGRRLHNKRVHPGLQFLVGSSGQPLLPSAIPSTLSTTSHQQNSHQPPAISYRPLAIPILEFCFIWEPFSFFLIILPSLVFPYFESRVESSHDTFSRLPGVSSLVSAVWCQRSGVSGLVPAAWSQQPGVSHLLLSTSS